MVRSSSIASSRFFLSPVAIKTLAWVIEGTSSHMNNVEATGTSLADCAHAAAVVKSPRNKVSRAWKEWDMEKNGSMGTDRFIRRKALVEMVGYSASSIWRRCRDGSFPQPIRLGPSAVAWRLSDVEAWMNSRQPVNKIR